MADWCRRNRSHFALPIPHLPIEMAKLILCVEDEQLSAEAVRRTLNYAGFEVRVAGTAA